MLTEILVFIIVFLLWRWRQKQRPDGFPSGPTNFPLVGCLPAMMSTKDKSMSGSLTELSRTYGKIYSVCVGGRFMVYVGDYDVIRETLSDPICTARPAIPGIYDRSFGKKLGILFTHGDVWKTLRRFTMRHLTGLARRRDAERVMHDEIHDLIGDVIRRVCGSDDSTTTLDFDRYLTLSVLNNLCSVMWGVRYQHNDERLHHLVRDVNRILKMTRGQRAILGAMPFLKHVFPEYLGYGPQMRAYKALQGFIRETMEEHKKTLTDDVDSNFMDTYLNKMNDISEEGEESVFNDEQLIITCQDLFLGGSETSSNVLGFAFLYMIANPHVQKSVQEEIDRVVGSSRLPSLDDRAQLPYTEATVMEILRHSNLVPKLPPRCPSEDTVIGGYRIPKGTMILLDMNSIHMDKEHWGDPQAFRPERFLDESGTNLVRDDHFIPFSIGKRSCVGEVLGRNSLFLYFSALMQRFQFSAAPGHTIDLQPVDGFTLSPKPHRLTVTER